MRFRRARPKREKWHGCRLSELALFMKTVGPDGRKSIGGIGDGDHCANDALPTKERRVFIIGLVCINKEAPAERKPDAKNSRMNTAWRWREWRRQLL